MKKAVLLIVTVTAVISLSACAGRENEKLSGVTDSIAGAESSDEIPDNGGIETDGKEHSRILIAYFTWAGNTYVENPEAVDVDATTSAAYFLWAMLQKWQDGFRRRLEGICFQLL